MENDDAILAEAATYDGWWGEHPWETIFDHPRDHEGLISNTVTILEGLQRFNKINNESVGAPSLVFDSNRISLSKIERAKEFLLGEGLKRAGVEKVLVFVCAASISFSSNIFHSLDHDDENYLSRDEFPSVTAALAFSTAVALLSGVPNEQDVRLILWLLDYAYRDGSEHARILGDILFSAECGDLIAQKQIVAFVQPIWSDLSGVDFQISRHVEDLGVAWGYLNNDTENSGFKYIKACLLHALGHFGDDEVADALLVEAAAFGVESDREAVEALNLPFYFATLK